MCKKKNINLIRVGHCLRFWILGVQNDVFISPATHSSHDAGRFDQKLSVLKYSPCLQRNLAFLKGGCDKSVFIVDCKIISDFLAVIVGLTSL